jgi:hypothetical protein
MSGTSASKAEGEIAAAHQDHASVDGGRRGTLASLNLNKNLDAK